MRSNRTFGFVAAFLALAGCTKVGVTQLAAGRDTSPKPSNCRLDVYSDPSEVKRKFVEVCLIDSRTGTTAFHDKSVAAAVDHARPKACECGADALIVTNAETKGVSMTGWGMGSAIIKAIAYVDAKKP